MYHLHRPQEWDLNMRTLSSTETHVIIPTCLKLGEITTIPQGVGMSLQNLQIQIVDLRVDHLDHQDLQDHRDQLGHSMIPPEDGMDHQELRVQQEIQVHRDHQEGHQADGTDHPTLIPMIPGHQEEAKVTGLMLKGLH
jgi:hypothetical protein